MAENAKLIAVPGYGDRTVHLQLLRQLPNVDLYILPFGSIEDFSRYEELYKEFSDKCKRIGPAAMVGFSFGGTVMRRYISDNPGMVISATTVASPVSWTGFSREFVENSYSMLAKVLDYDDQHKINDKKLIDRAYIFGRDKTVPSKTSYDPQAKMIEIPHLGHLSGIIYTCLCARKFLRPT